jgi:hypothetical protein
MRPGAGIIPEGVHPMVHRIFAAATVAMLGLACVSCGGTAKGLTSASGKVLCNGEPAAGAILIFHRLSGGEAPPAEAAGIIPSANVQGDGRFTVESQPMGYGIAPGKYAILVEWSQEADPAQAGTTKTSKTSSGRGKSVTVSKRSKFDAVPVDRLKGRYMDKGKPAFEREIKAGGSNDLGTIELEMK